MAARFFSAAILLVATIGCTASSNGPTSPSAAGAKGQGVILLRYNPGSESTEQREKGFLDTLAKDYPQIKVLSSDQYSGTTPETSLDKSQQLLLKFRDQVGGVFAVCEPNARGMLGALEEAGMAGKVKFVGFDPSPEMINALADGKMCGIVLQDPVNMGYLSVKAIVNHLDGQSVEPRIPTGEFLATPANMKTEEMARLLDPPKFSDQDAAAAGDIKYRIAVIPKGTTHEFWKSVHAGAAKAAQEIGGVEITWKGPLLENDRDMQINVVQDFKTKKVNGIVLAPLDALALVRSVKEAKDAGIPTVIFDSGLSEPDVTVSYVATDNYQGGVLAAHCLAEAMGFRQGSGASDQRAADIEQGTADSKSP